MMKGEIEFELQTWDITKIALYIGNGKYHEILYTKIHGYGPK